jgi:hypothetical protein
MSLWPGACATFAPAGRRTALACRTLVNFIVAADVSRLKLLTRRNEGCGLGQLFVQWIFHPALIARRMLMV